MQRRELGPIEHCMWHGDKVSRLNFTTVATIHGALEREHLERALEHLQKRHPLLRARVVTSWGKPAMVFDQQNPIKIHEHDLDEQATFALTEERLRAWIDPTKPPLMRFDWVRRADKTNTHTLLLTFHHIIGDGISGTLAARDLLEASAAVARGESLPAPTPLPIRESIERCVPKEVRRKGMWRQFFTHARGLLSWIWKHGRPSGPRLDRQHVRIQDRQINMARRTLSKAETDTLVEAAREHQTTVHGALAASIMTTIAEDLGKTSPLLFGSPVDVRERVEPKVGDDIGMYVALGVTLHEVDPDKIAFWDLAKQARDDLHAQIEDGGAHTLLPMQARFLALAARLLPAPWFGAFVETAQLPAIGLTNIGRVQFDADFSPFSLEALSFAVSTGVLGKVGVTATTYNGVLTLNFMGMDPCITREHLNALADRVIALVRLNSEPTR
ncbi:MAG: condensation domain-containing protein [Myxococcota bacterium]|nr:condensation domain-containing protein [Myxococcota bacterium]